MQLFLAGVALVVGLLAAWRWFQADSINISPSTYDKDGQQFFQLMYWVESVMSSSKSAAELNKRAALWRALSVLASAALSVVGALH